ncbi:hypothetical protein [Bacillus solimangrovi]|uniref:Uncharacterized protein n=1 Tax=Bacillus solimangrovi TaxID=1305675 RepID=A0A1E5LIE6_9BACI|nr:hypothetical protein [Bacillus solimangrovi]OEH93828.1 hypothetical protein BFG57_10930 [Bacillus solimangrovi]
MNQPLETGYPSEILGNVYIFPEGEALRFYNISGNTISWIEIKDDFLVCTWQAHFKDDLSGSLETFLKMNIINEVGQAPVINNDMLLYSHNI